MTIAFFADHVENPANRARIADAAHLLGGTTASQFAGHLIAVENTRGAMSIYGRPPLRGTATLALGNERRGLAPATLEAADETVVIPTQSRSVNTLNVAAAAAVAGWYVLKGSGPQAQASRPDQRRPAVLLVGDDHVEVGSSLRSAAAFGFRDVMLCDVGAGWFAGSGGIRREARAAARSFKNPLRIHRATLEAATSFENVLVIAPSDRGSSIERHRLAKGARELVIIGADPDEIARLGPRIQLATLGLRYMERPPLRLVASIVLAEIARQVGRRRIAAPTVRMLPKYELAVRLMPLGEVLTVDTSDLLVF